jgi:hypothetical protein
VTAVHFIFLFKVIQGSSPVDLGTELPYQCTMKRKVRKKKKKGIITANVAGTKFEIGEFLQNSALFIISGKTALALKAV